MAREYIVSLCFAEWETMAISAESPEEALELARKTEEMGDWDGSINDRERLPYDDTVCGLVMEDGEARIVDFITGIKPKNVLDYFDNTRQIAIVWDINDVKSERPDLTDEQAMEVLQDISKHHDADLGVCWETIRVVADNLFPKDGGK